MLAEKRVDISKENFFFVLVMINTVKKVVITRPNTTIQIYSVSLYYTLQHVSAVLFSHHKVVAGYTKSLKRKADSTSPWYKCIFFLCIQHLLDDS